MQLAKICIDKTIIAQSNIVLSKKCFLTIQRKIQIPGIMNNTQLYFVDGKRKKGAVSPSKDN